MNRGLIFQFTVEYHCLVGIVLLNGDIQLCLRAGDGIAGVLQLFTANKIGVTQRHTTVKVALRLRQGGFLHVDIRLQLLAVNHQLVRLAHAGGQRRFGFFKRLFGVSLIERDQNIALFYKVGVISPDFRHAA